MTLKLGAAWHLAPHAALQAKTLLGDIRRDPILQNRFLLGTHRLPRGLGGIAQLGIGAPLLLTT